jgi:hypothetical protein
VCKIEKTAENGVRFKNTKITVSLKKNLFAFSLLACFCVVDDPEFTEVIRQAEAAIDAGAFPVRIYQVPYLDFLH